MKEKNGKIHLVDPQPPQKNFEIFSSLESGEIRLSPMKVKDQLVWSYVTAEDINIL